MNVRASAARVISQVMNGVSLAESLPQAITKFSDKRDQALLQAICYGVCRSFFSLVALLDILLEKKLKNKDDDIFALLLIGIFQLKEMRIPDHAAVGETVAATKILKKIWAKDLVNAVLRRYQREQEKLNLQLENNFVSKFSMPEWLVGMIQKAWPNDYEKILAANNEHPPFSLRVNQNKITRELYLQRLLQKNIHAETIPLTDYGIVLEEPVDVGELPDFAQGFVSVQDGAAQLAATLLELSPDQRVLDACAAPGGKTTHITELMPANEVIAIDVSEERIKSVKENLHRLGAKAECIVADVADVSRWWDGRPLDRILLDVPCSATGVIRRHPDIKILRRPEDVANLAEEQHRLLTAVWPLLKIGGVLVYATCSILPKENSKVIQDFLKIHSDAIEEKIIASWGLPCEVGRQILPGMHGMDGFYYARLRKKVPPLKKEGWGGFV